MPNANWFEPSYVGCYNYHPVLEMPNANLVAGMAWLQSTYSGNMPRVTALEICS